MKDELITILESLLTDCRHKTVSAEGALVYAEDRERAVELVLAMLKEPEVKK